MLFVPSTEGVDEHSLSSLIRTVLSHGLSRFLLGELANPLSASVFLWQHCDGAIVVR